MSGKNRIFSLMTSISDPYVELSENEEVTGLDRQNVMRLRINQAALLHGLTVAHVVPYLVNARVLNAEDLQNIDEGSTSQERTQRLLNILPNKQRNTQWYKHFKAALLHAIAKPEVLERYQGLVDFLDNSIIHRPSSQNSSFSSKDSMTFPHYQPLPDIGKGHHQTAQSNCIRKVTCDEAVKARRPDTPRNTQNILNLDTVSSEDFDEEIVSDTGEFERVPPNKNGMTLVKGFYHQWISPPDNFRSFVVIPLHLLESLDTSSLSEDKVQLQVERKVLKKMQNIEIIAALSRRGFLPEGFEFCTCDAISDLISDDKSYPFSFKYFTMLKENEVDLISEMVDSFESVTNTIKLGITDDLTDQIVSIGFHLVDFLICFDAYASAEAILESLQQFLNTFFTLEKRRSSCQARIKLMEIKNRNSDLEGAHQAYHVALDELTHLDVGPRFQTLLALEQSQYLFGKGQLEKAYLCVMKVLQDLSANDHSTMVLALNHAVMVSCSLWKVKAAELLAVHAVRYAWQHFGKHHPYYVKAMLSLSLYCNEFRQDTASVTMAQNVLEHTQKVYSYDSLDVALAHRTVSKALLVVQDFNADMYYHHATEALRIVSLVLPSSHPIQYYFKHTAASVLQWKAQYVSKESHLKILQDAELVGIEALRLAEKTWGRRSLRASQGLLLLTQILTKMEEFKDAEETLLTSIRYLKYDQAPGSYHIRLAEVTIGLLYKVLNKPKEAELHLKEALNGIEPVGVYLKWVEIAYETLIFIQQSMSSRVADHTQIQLAKWLRDSPRHKEEITPELLDQPPSLLQQTLETIHSFNASL